MAAQISCITAGAGIMWCKHCKRTRLTYVDDATPSVCCNECGRIITQYSIFHELYSSEINECLNTKAETRFKTIIWEPTSRRTRRCFGSVKKGVVFSVQKNNNLYTERQQNNALEGKRTKAAQNGLEETGKSVTKKRLSSRVNYNGTRETPQ